ncbi:MAG: bacterial proteasome activator family protein [Acidimicrobiales bacterium]
MSLPQLPETPDTEPEVVAPELVPDRSKREESVEQPAKVMRIASMIRLLLEEVRQAPLDEASRNRLREIYETSIEELCDGLSPALRDELSRVSMPFGEGTIPSEGELRVAQAQLVGWLEGLFHGIQATMFAQQMAIKAEHELERRSLPPGPEEPQGFVRPPGYL